MGSGGGAGRPIRSRRPGWARGGAGEPRAGRGAAARGRGCGRRGAGCASSRRLLGLCFPGSVLLGPQCPPPCAEASRATLWAGLPPPRSRDPPKGVGPRPARGLGGPLFSQGRPLIRRGSRRRPQRGLGLRPLSFPPARLLPLLRLLPLTCAPLAPGRLVFSQAAVAGDTPVPVLTVVSSAAPGELAQCTMRLAGRAAAGWHWPARARCWAPRRGRTCSCREGAL